LKYIRGYVGYNKIKAYVSYPILKDVLSYQDFLGTRWKWVSNIYEYELDINPTNIIKGQGLAKMLAVSDEETIKMGENDQVNVFLSELENEEWNSKIIYYLNNISFLEHLLDHKE
jgi:hypothetical protein